MSNKLITLDSIYNDASVIYKFIIFNLCFSLFIFHTLNYFLNKINYHP